MVPKLHFPHNCEILPKKCHVAPFPLDTQTAPLATRGIAHSTQTKILYGRRSAISGYFTVSAYRRMREEGDSTSPVKHVRIFW